MSVELANFGPSTNLSGRMMENFNSLLNREQVTSNGSFAQRQNRNKSLLISMNSDDEEEDDEYDSEDDDTHANRDEEDDEEDVCVTQCVIGKDGMICKKECASLKIDEQDSDDDYDEEFDEEFDEDQQEAFVPSLSYMKGLENLKKRWSKSHQSNGKNSNSCPIQLKNKKREKEDDSSSDDDDDDDDDNDNGNGGCCNSGCPIKGKHHHAKDHKNHKHDHPKGSLCAGQAVTLNGVPYDGVELYNYYSSSNPTKEIPSSHQILTQKQARKISKLLKKGYKVISVECNGKVKAHDKVIKGDNYYRNGFIQYAREISECIDRSQVHHTEKKGMYGKKKEETVAPFCWGDYVRFGIARYINSVYCDKLPMGKDLEYIAFINDPQIHLIDSPCSSTYSAAISSFKKYFGNTGIAETYVIPWCFGLPYVLNAYELDYIKRAISNGDCLENAVQIVRCMQQNDCNSGRTILSPVLTEEEFASRLGKIPESALKSIAESIPISGKSLSCYCASTPIQDIYECNLLTGQPLGPAWNHDLAREIATYDSTSQILQGHEACAVRFIPLTGMQ